ncbi:hypothetical protein CLV91_0392 [Maribacter vaceletii]|uniref:Fibronectin type-III domain-containing protein n=1 Tax=Maribacter vaceletii TaxID=1206816 RepID=A0A495EEK6_9FLAO|nr:hypothetical protein [Maribacter vaceletii]RKR14317.1 hypothetical protein CLV91_0392 [Maribacter vaceletii]
MKNIRILRRIQVLLGFLIITSCGGNKDSGEKEEVILDPTKAVLVYPDNNEECTGGTAISDTESKLNFDWNKADNTSSYTLFVKNLDANSVEEFNASSDAVEVTLERGVPYSWYVVSKSNKTTVSATSETWKFYLAGLGTQNYAPFPADLTNPENETEVTTLSIDLEWIGSDVDNDIKEYDVYLDTNANPTTKVGTTATANIEGYALKASKTYYWKVVTHDLNGNTSTSQVYSFVTN